MSLSFRVRPMYQRGLDEFVMLECGPTGNIREHDVSENQEYHLVGKITVPFWANPAQLADARRIAAQVLFRELYHEVLRLLPQLRLSISNGDRNAAYRQCDLIEVACNDVERLFRDDRRSA